VTTTSRREPYALHRRRHEQVPSAELLVLAEDGPPDSARRLSTRLGPAVAATTALWLLGLIGTTMAGDIDDAGGLLIVPLLAALTYPIARQISRIQQDVQIRRLVFTGLLLKGVGTCLRYAMAFSLYGGVSDAGTYHNAGKVLAQGFRHGNYNVGTEAVTSTRFVEVVTGVVYAIFGANRLGGFFVFSWLSFWGAYLYFRSFQMCFPHGDQKRYARLLFLLPSLLFWPSSTGKDAWMCFTIGVAVYGAARLLSANRFGLPVLLAGLWGCASVRPHVAAIVIVALGLSFLLRRATGRAAGMNLLLKVFMVGLMVVVLLVVVQQVQHKFSHTRSKGTDLSSILNYTELQTSQGGSSFTPARVSTPLDLPWATVTVLFRPFPYEAHTTQGLVTSLEGAFLVVLLLRSWRRVTRIVGEMFRTPYVTFCVLFTLAFVWVFSSIGNFGILVRQRVQIYPVFLVLLCLPAVKERIGRRDPSVSSPAGTGRRRSAAATVDVRG
jgi:hypothetical protein